MVILVAGPEAAIFLFRVNSIGVNLCYAAIGLSQWR